MKKVFLATITLLTSELQDARHIITTTRAGNVIMIEMTNGVTPELIQNTSAAISLPCLFTASIRIIATSVFQEDEPEPAGFSTAFAFD